MGVRANISRRVWFASVAWGPNIKSSAIRIPAFSEFFDASTRESNRTLSGMPSSAATLSLVAMSAALSVTIKYDDVIRTAIKTPVTAVNMYLYVFLISSSSFRLWSRSFFEHLFRRDA